MTGRGSLFAVGVALVAAASAAQAANAQDRALALRFAPVVWLHSADRFGPMAPDTFIANSSLRWRKRLTDGRVAPQGKVAPARLGAGCVKRRPSCYQWDSYRADHLTRPFDKGSARPARLKTDHGFYLDVADSAREGNLGTNPATPMFYELRPAGAGTRITYWLFYGFSRPYAPYVGANFAARFSHEGDWERVEVALDGRRRPTSITYHAHRDAHPHPWREICKDVGGREICGTSVVGRPIVFSARESHASYPTPADRKSDATATCRRIVVRFCSHDLRNRGTRWDPTGRRLGLRDVRAEAWYGFGGAWGKPGPDAVGLGSETTGPLGPSPYKR